MYQALAANLEYSAFGDEQPTTAAKRFTSETTTPTTGTTGVPEVTFNLRYPGQYFDAETKLHYNYFRSYDSRTGRYTQGDPIGLDGGWNRFGYVGGNPLSSTDSTGLLVDFVFDVNEGSLKSDCSCMSGSIDAFSGQGSRMNNSGMEHVAGGGPIPRGRYFIIDPYIHTRNPLADLGGLTFFRLMPDDGQYADGRNVSVPGGSGTTIHREKFRFHPGTISRGCVTTSNIEAWKKIQFELLNRTKVEFLPNGQPYLGTITVR